MSHLPVGIDWGIFEGYSLTGIFRVYSRYIANIPRISPGDIWGQCAVPRRVANSYRLGIAADPFLPFVVQVSFLLRVGKPCGLSPTLLSFVMHSPSDYILALALSRCSCSSCFAYTYLVLLQYQLFDPLPCMLASNNFSPFRKDHQNHRPRSNAPSTRTSRPRLSPRISCNPLWASLPSYLRVNFRCPSRMPSSMEATKTNSVN